MYHPRAIFGFLCFFLLSSGLARQTIDKDALPGYQSIQPNDLHAHLMFLASTELEGRETTFRGQKVAAQYLAAQFRKFGLKPVAGTGSFLQEYSLEVTRPSPESKITLTIPTGRVTTFKMYSDFIPTIVRESTLTAPVLLIGFVDNRLDSVATQQMQGKIIMAFAGNRSAARDTSIPGVRRLFASRQFPGSAGLLLVVDEKVQGTIASEIAPNLSAMLEKGTMRLPGTAPGRGLGGNVYLVSSALAHEITKTAQMSIEKLRERAFADSLFKPILFDQAMLTIDSRVMREHKTAENVVGMLEGSDPILKNEAVIFTAHYDHIGIGSDGAIYYGADDDGSGTSVLLELAEAYAMNPRTPKRTLIFMAVSGEEKGLLGSRYYVENPLFPLERTTANINMDMVGRVDRKYQEKNTDDYTYVIGSDKISPQLDSLLNAANRQSENLILDYTYNSDNDPNQFYRRSDHYNFAQKGIPVVFFFTGIHEDYHRPTDTVDKILFEKTARIARLAYYLGWKVADADRDLLKKNNPTSSH
jgi:Zn-dependent M28 family amino/carboxypeptidase